MMYHLTIVVYMSSDWSFGKVLITWQVVDPLWSFGSFDKRWIALKAVDHYTSD